MDQDTLTFLQWALLLVDGAGIFASFDRMMFYRIGRKKQGVFEIYVFFFVTFCVFMTRAFSDLCVIQKWPLWWATLPIIRGIGFQLPIVVTLLWMIDRQHHDHH